MNPGEFPHSEISGSMLICSSPKLIAAYHVFHRLPVPRHSPCALVRLTIQTILFREWLVFPLDSLLPTKIIVIAKGGSFSTVSTLRLYSSTSLACGFSYEKKSESFSCERGSDFLFYFTGIPTGRNRSIACILSQSRKSSFRVTPKSRAMARRLSSVMVCRMMPPPMESTLT